MSVRKTVRTYYFSVEGETEKWYLEWLCKQINEETSSKCNVSIKCKVEKNPVKMVKSMVITDKVNIWHLIDYESREKVHQDMFMKTIDNMKKAQKLGKKVKYSLGYSNLTFELWMILHKTECNCRCEDRKKYLKYINKEFAHSFQSIDEYKSEKNFKNCLNKLNLCDVNNAIKRSINIMKDRERDSKLELANGYCYYMANPSLEIWVPISQILKDTDLLKK